MTPRPYCGRCHKWMEALFYNMLVCDCTASGLLPDTTKDPNCHNSGHDHYDPESPIVLAQQAEERPFFEVTDELDEILEDTNEQIEVARPLSAGDFSPRHHGPPHHDHDDNKTDCLVRGHVWVRYGRVTAGVDFGVREAETVSVVDWGPVKCMRCGEPAPEEEKPCLCERDEETGFRYDIVCPRYDGEFEVTAEMLGKEEPKPACGGCHLRDLTMRDAKEHIRKLLELEDGLVSQWGRAQVCLEASRFLRMSENKIRAMKEED